MAAASARARASRYLSCKTPPSTASATTTRIDTSPKATSTKTMPRRRRVVDLCNIVPLP
jgi:hypothetical protein